MDIFVKSLKSLIVAASLLTATNAVAESPYILDPAPGEVNELSMIKISFSGDWELGSNRSARFEVTGPEGVEIPAIRSQSFRTYYGVFFENDAILTSPGTYTFTIPEGRFASYNRDLPAETFVYTIVGNTEVEPLPEFTLTPESGIYKTIDEFSMTFDTTEEIILDTSNISITGPAYYYTLLCDIEGNTVKMKAVDEDGKQTPLYEPGDYTLTFGRKSIQVGKATNDTNIVYRYTITGNNVGDWTGEVTADPENGSSVDELHIFNITFTGAGVVKISDSAGPDEFPSLYNAKTGALVSQSTAFSSGSRLDLTLTVKVNTPGEYELLIPRRFIKVDGYYPEADIKLHYTIEGEVVDVAYTYTFSPEPGSLLGVLEPVMVTFAGDNLASMSFDMFAWGKNVPHFVNDFGGYNPYVQIAQSGFSFIFTHEWPFEKSGTYTFVIPAGYFTFFDNDGNSIKNDAINIDYKIATTSIIELSEDKKSDDIYHVTGVKVNSDSSGLTPGVYIINGKKTFIK